MTKQPRGKFITVEGQDGTGKTTNLEYIRDLLNLNGIEVLVSREPGGTRLGEALRRVILDGHDLEIEATAETLLIFAARAQHLATKILPALDAGIWVLCDRFTDATYAYQSGGRGVPADNIALLERLVQGNTRPDLTLLLDADLETAQTRSQHRPAQKLDRFEAQEMTFKQSVREAYLGLATQYPGRIRIIQAGQDLISVQLQIRRVILEFLELHS